MTILQRCSSLTLAALVGIGSLCGCDSLWFNYTKPDPDFCTSRMPQCDNGYICNPTTGACVSEDAVPSLVFRDVSPKWLPMSGGPIVIQGAGFQYGNVSSQVSIAETSTTNTTVTPDKIVTTAPAFQTACMSVPLTIDRTDGFYQSIDNAIFYRFEPYSINGSTPIVGGLGIIDQFQVAQLDLDDPRADFLFKKTNGTFGVIPNESNIILLSSEAIPFIKVVPGYFTTASKKSNIAGVTDDQVYIYSKDAANMINQINFFTTSKKGNKDALSIDIDPIMQDRDELVIINYEPANGSFIYGYKIKADTAASFNFSAKYVLSLDYIAHAVTTYRSSSSGAIDRLLISGTATNTRIPGTDVNRGLYHLVTFNGDFKSDQYITDAALPPGLVSLLASDLDQDGSPDIAGYSKITGNVYVTLSKYKTTKILRAYGLSQNKPASVNLQAVDANCDGSPDLFISDPTGNETAVLHYNNFNDFNPEPVALLQAFSGQTQKISYALSFFPSTQNQIPKLLYLVSSGLYLGSPSYQKP